ncbi:26S proteasome complex ubiquitin receptor, subunit Rpn13 [Pochonia chlamydosporia 170]|uniref:26S proteasome complex ubiquitin receptor, subunit Rpn13 n=1 Tax=Pochonia chlamydosporia 170 TaxID=1380566 RepID=A0A179G4A4_METCM|nr:26S proteasome complex ubiquitin receptor, subunit Rpn13 [Pochonia chlamydosporia 170]OAQ72627.1 26S proteasome complex ubiquitin receptor, subunit Rpn13 [Pochonia chlamydosporia 170]
MPIAPIITFKAGQCEVDESSSRPLKVKPQPQPGYLYLYSEDDLIHFCWRKRDQSLDEPELDLVMVPTDGSFVPYEYNTTSEPTAKTNGRIFVLKFASSSQRYLFWMQSKPQSRDGNPSWFSPRDRKIGDVVHRLLQGEEVNVMSELSSVRNVDDRDDDDDETMEDVEGSRGQHAHRGSGSGGAGPDATGGDVREEGEESREGGADGARAASSSAPDAAAAVRNFLESLRGQQGLSGGQQQQQHADVPYPYLNHLLPTSITVPMIDGASPEFIDSLLSFLPPSVIVLAASSVAAEESQKEPSADAIEAAKASLSLEDKRSLLKKVLRSPQFNQALGTLTMALRDGGLPGVADALGIRVENGGYMQGGGMPLGGGQAVKSFVDGVKKTVKERRQ